MRRKSTATAFAIAPASSEILSENPASGVGEKEHDAQRLGHHQLGATLIRRPFSPDTKADFFPSKSEKCTSDSKFSPSVVLVSHDY